MRDSIFSSYMAAQHVRKHVYECALKTYWLNLRFWMIKKTFRGRLIMTSSNGSIFRITGPLWGEFTVYQWIPLTKARDAELWCFFDLRLKNWLSRSFETPWRSFWCHCHKRFCVGLRCLRDVHELLFQSYIFMIRGRPQDGLKSKLACRWLAG